MSTPSLRVRQGNVTPPGPCYGKETDYEDTAQVPAGTSEQGAQQGSWGCVGPDPLRIRDAWGPGSCTRECPGALLRGEVLVLQPFYCLPSVSLCERCCGLSCCSPCCGHCCCLSCWYFQCDLRDGEVPQVQALWEPRTCQASGSSNLQ